MSLTSASQIPKPLDEQALERACTVLWRGLLKDPNVHKNGRRGQKQRGVDLYGCRDGEPSWDWAAVLAEMRARLIDGPRQYVAQWTFGHFLPLGRLRQADRAVTLMRLAAGSGG